LAAPLPGRAGSSLAGGTVLGPYRIVRPLGQGGMGAVYEADEVPSGRRVALKILKERLHDPRERERFSREGRLAASLNHPHCVFVFAASEVDGRLAIAMELMHSSLLTRRFARAGQ
jgi:serine/threonine protein kinase